ncbi:LLM class flavin-dependent oxidoreductase [Amycolatopsis sp. PS_44_ISF1]|uniref:LLM class flavin-dependent oxidoreductase n=1 Tax=Amycolatopsis sp. PS_44_ISF1 TaxID=2974917 RepID=UPI0028E0135C|nr:LLM class flavin-dependent oxidoreductase [Amycolatopsis sp. PS_44_ISF1]MDT8913353.1 LLM class flavin-dependent oxidoreductase [Amycolatopsis sp. PS_44_ISF1]
MKIGIGLPNQVRDMAPRVLPGWARRAEAAGFSTLATVGRTAYPGVLDTVALAAAAGATERIGLLSGVLLGPVWPPVLLAKELAGIDGVSGNRLTIGLGIGAREDDFVVDGRGPRGLGQRIDADLETYREVWDGEPVGGGTNPAVPPGTRRVPLLLGGSAPASYARMAKWGEGYVGGSVPPELVAPSFDQARAAWAEAGREGSPRLVALAYFALGDPEQGRGKVHDYYSNFGALADLIAGGVRTTPGELRQAVSDFAALGADELIFNPGTDNPADIEALAEVVL